MKQPKPLTKGELDKMTESLFVTLTPNKLDHNKQNIVVNAGRDYTDLMSKIEALLSVTMSAIEAKKELGKSYHSDDDLIQTLEIAKELIPFPEIEFIDTIYKRFVIPKASKHNLSKFVTSDQ